MASWKLAMLRITGYRLQEKNTISEYSQLLQLHNSNYSNYHLIPVTAIDMTGASKIQLWKLEGLQKSPQIMMVYVWVVIFLNFYTIRPLTINCLCWSHMTGMTFQLLQTYINSCSRPLSICRLPGTAYIVLIQKGNALGYIGVTFYSLLDSAGYWGHLEKPLCRRYA